MTEPILDYIKELETTLLALGQSLPTTKEDVDFNAISLMQKEIETLKKQLEVAEGWWKFHAKREIELIEKYRGIKLPE